MKHCIILISLIFLASCGKAPDCHYTGDFDAESNAGCLVVDKGKALFVEGRNGKLALPGGGKSSGEAPQCTAEREVWEETGIEVMAKKQLITFDNSFQLFRCDVVGQQVLDGSKRPWRLEVDAIHWLASNEFEGKEWRFPEQVEWIQGQLKAIASSKAN